VPPRSPHVQGWNAARACASTSHAARGSGLGREEEVAARVFQVVACRRMCAPSPAWREKLINSNLN
jgi:hypothetical protein